MYEEDSYSDAEFEDPVTNSIATLKQSAVTSSTIRSTAHKNFSPASSLIHETTISKLQSPLATSADYKGINC